MERQESLLVGAHREPGHLGGRRQALHQPRGRRRKRVQPCHARTQTRGKDLRHPRFLHLANLHPAGMHLAGLHPETLNPAALHLSSSHPTFRRETVPHGRHFPICRPCIPFLRDKASRTDDISAVARQAEATVDRIDACQKSASSPDRTWPKRYTSKPIKHDPNKNLQFTRHPQGVWVYSSSRITYNDQRKRSLPR